MKSWDLTSIDVEPHKPEVITSTDEARAIVIQLPAGEQLQEHEVHERALVSIVAGEAKVTSAGGDSVDARAGHLFEFDPRERHEVEATSDARLLLVLAPWPGDGHPSEHPA
jgi:quercetin dioxygenase-like cupin family protein